MTTTLSHAICRALEPHAHNMPARCELPRGHEGDHASSWRTIAGERRVWAWANEDALYDLDDVVAELGIDEDVA